MSTLPAANAISDAENQGILKGLHEAVVACAKETPGGAAESELTIASGSITPTGASHTVDTESDAASDDLANILTTNHPAGRLLLLRCADASRVTTLVDQAGGAGQIHTLDGEDLDLDALTKRVKLQRVGADWYVVEVMGVALPPAEDSTAKSLASTTTLLTPANLAAMLTDHGGFPGFKNGLINGGFRVAQRGTSFTAATTPANSDDTYLLDRWLLLSDGNDIVDVSQEASVVPTGAYAALKALVATANKKFGFVQIIEARDAARFAGKTVSVSCQARTTSGAVVENVRMAVLSWSSTADSVTSDVVSAWGNEGENPTFAANWTAENVAANQAVTADAYATLKVEGISVDTAGMKNLAVFVWVDDTDCAANDLLYLGNVQIEEGTVATTFESRPFTTELALCQRYFQKSYRQGYAPGSANSITPMRGYLTGWYGDVVVNDFIGFNVLFPVTMRAVPTLTLYAPSDGESGKINIGAAKIVATIEAAMLSDCGFGYSNYGNLGSQGDQYAGHWTANAEL